MGVITSWNRSTGDELINLHCFWALMFAELNFIIRFRKSTILHPASFHLNRNYPLTSVVEVPWAIIPAALMLNSFSPGKLTCFWYSCVPAAWLQISSCFLRARCSYTHSFSAFSRTTLNSLQYQYWCSHCVLRTIRLITYPLCMCSFIKWGEHSDRSINILKQLWCRGRSI